MPSISLAVFYSYAHEDEALRDMLDKHLSLLKRQGVITGWHDREITAGGEWADRISEHLESAQIVLLLISADFLASNYCHDVEMMRALERHEEKDAHVIPIILRPVDWEGAPFGKLQCLPRDARPVTLWENQDAAFLDIARGIRKVAETFGQRGNSGSRPRNSGAAWKNYLAYLIPIVRMHWRRVLSIAGALLLVGWGWLGYSDKYEKNLADGRYYLNIGHYQQAKVSFQQAIDVHPVRRVAALSRVFGDQAAEAVQQALDLFNFSDTAHLGLEKASAFDSGNAEQIDRTLAELEKQYPNDMDIEILRGKVQVSRGDYDQARVYFKAALEKDPDAAEAYFGLGFIYDQEGNVDGAVKMFEKAAVISSRSPRYAINLADQYAKLGQYDEALQLYAKFDQDYPVAALESSHLYRFEGKLTKALNLQNITLGLLKKTGLIGKPENQEPWSYNTDLDRITLSDPVDKECYVYYTLAATLYLDGQETESEQYHRKARDLTEAHQVEIKELVDFDLRRLKEVRPEMGARIDAYRRELGVGKVTSLLFTLHVH